MFWRAWRKPADNRLGEEIREIREELRTVRALLERLLNQQATHAPDPSPAPPVDRPMPSPRPDPEQLLTQLTQWLMARRLRMNSYLQNQYRGPMDEEMYHLGFFMSQHYPVVAAFLAELRATLSRPRRIYFPLPATISADELAILTNIATRLYRLRILYQYLYDRSRGQIMAWVDAHPESRNYLSGAWFEMGVFQAVRKKLGNAPALLLRDVQLNCDGGGNCELDILIYLHNGDRRLVLLECKSGAGGLKPEEVPQVRRAVNLLNLGIQRAAVVLPEPPAKHLADQWTQQTGASIIGFSQLDAFLQQALA